MAIESKKSSSWGAKAASAVVGGALLLTGSIVPAQAALPTGSAGTLVLSKTSGTWAAGDLAATALNSDMVCPSTGAMSGALVFISEPGAERPAAADNAEARSLYSFTQDPMFQMSLDANNKIAAASTLENGFRNGANEAVDMAAAVEPNHTYSIGYVCTQQSADFASTTVNTVEGKPVAAWATLKTDADRNWTITGNAFESVVAPTLSGFAVVGYSLKANITDPVPAADVISIQWLRNGKLISGARDMYYRQVAADLGTRISVRVQFAAANYDTVTKFSPSVITKGVFTKVTAPKIFGTAAVGYTVAAGVNLPSPAPTALYYRWLRNGVVISGATAKTYKLTALDRGKQIRSRIYFARPGYLMASSTSAAILPKAVFSNVVAPKVYGTALVGRTLLAGVTKPSPLPAGMAYRWLRNGVVISGANYSSYKLTALDRGKQIRSRVYFFRSGYLTASATSFYKLVR